MSEPRVHLVLVPGWGHDSQIWQDVAAHLPVDWQLHYLEWPGCNDETDSSSRWELPSMLEHLIKQVAAKAVWCGWSLGGQLATLVAHRFPEQVSGLITLCSNPRFVVDNDWPCAMPKSIFQAFVDSAKQQPEQTLRRFRQLAVKGAATARADFRRLQAFGQSWTADGLVAGLTCLQNWDMRTLLPQLAMPQVHLLSTADALVPPESGAHLAELAADIDVQELEGAGHTPMLSHPLWLADWLVNLISRKWAEC